MQIKTRKIAGVLFISLLKPNSEVEGSEMSQDFGNKMDKRYN